MAYWFENPTLKALAPLALSTSIKGLTTIINIPAMFIGSNVFPEGPVVGPSTMDTLANRCAKKRAFIVTDGFSNKFAGKASRFLQSGGFTVEIWPKCLPEAPMEVVAECAKAMKVYEPDLIMAVGGGSVMDSAKAAWVLYERPDITELGMISPLDKLNLRKKALLAAVPTTAGTGSECTDVLAHAMDAVTTPAANEITEPMALKAIEMTFQWLPRAYKNGQDREARHRMMLAASMAGIAFGMSGCHLTHSFGHSLGAVFNLHHGMCVGFFLPQTLQFCSPVTDKHLLICRILGIEAKDAKRGLVKLVARVRSFLTELGVPLTLKGLGISRADFDRQFDTLVKFAVEDVDCYFSPRPITAAQCAQVFRYAYDGRDIDF
jgi:alcohol dehydrogenase class IV